METVPEVAHRGGRVTMICHYDLGDKPLYYVKWYRGNFEFYRYTPSEDPPHKIFPYPGIQVNLTLSNGNQVVLERLGLGLSGKVSCEVTTDTPIPETTSISGDLTVLDLPESGPVIQTDRSPKDYQAGDFLKANCTTPPSKPAPTITLTINDFQCWQVGTCERRIVPVSDTLQLSTTYLSMRLKPNSFKAGVILIKCSAVIKDFYHEQTELAVQENKLAETIMLGSLGKRKHDSSCVSRPISQRIHIVILHLLFILTMIT